MVAFQRLIGEHGPAPALLERDAFVASAVPGIPSSLINAACPRDDAPLAPHLDEIARFYADMPEVGCVDRPRQHARCRGARPSAGWCSTPALS